MSKQYSKANLVEELALLNDVESGAAASRIVEFIFDKIRTNVTSGTDVNLAGFINLRKATQAAKPAREGRNPSTGENMQIAATPAKQVVRIKPTAPFKKQVAGV